MYDSKDFVPRRDVEFNLWFRRIHTTVIENTSGGDKAIWKHIPAEVVKLLGESYAKWFGAYEPCMVPHAKPLTVKKNEVKREVTAFLRQFIAQYLMFSPVTDDQREELELHNKDRKPNPVPVQEEAPEFFARPIAAATLVIDFHQKGSTSRAKPYGTKGALICCLITDQKPLDQTLLGNPQLATRSPYHLKFKEADRGKRVFIAMCWVNNRGEQSPWSEIVEAIIP